MDLDADRQLDELQNYLRWLEGSIRQPFEFPPEPGNTRSAREIIRARSVRPGWVHPFWR